MQGYKENLLSVSAARPPRALPGTIAPRTRRNRCWWSRSPTIHQQRTTPFPQTVAINEVRRAFLAYGLSGTPTFVLVDGQGIVQSYATGYSPQKGLGIDGWTWRDRPAQKP